MPRADAHFEGVARLDGADVALSKDCPMEEAVAGPVRLQSPPGQCQRGVGSRRRVVIRWVWRYGCGLYVSASKARRRELGKS